LCPGGKDNFGFAVVVQIGYDWLGSKTVKAFAGVVDRIGPVAVLGLVQPESMQLAI
jgi:hypothetical protein